MTEDAPLRIGGCLCGAVRYEVEGEPQYAGLCFCEDCRKASGGGFIPFMNYPRARFRVSGETRQVRTGLSDGREAVRNICTSCGSLLFGGEYGRDEQHTVYAGTLDDPSSFKPTMAIMTQGKPDWAVIPEGLKIFGRMPA